MEDAAYRYWIDTLAWCNDHSLPRPDFDKARPEAGFYRGQRNEAVAIWWLNGDRCVARVYQPNRTGGGVTHRDYEGADIIGESVFAYCCRRPITFEAFTAFEKAGRWPEDVRPGTKSTPKAVDSIPSLESEPGTERNESRSKNLGQEKPKNLENLGTLESRLNDEISALIAAAETWMAIIGGPMRIKDKVEADKLANYSLLAQEIEKRASAAREAEKKPFLDGGRAVDAKWNPIVNRAGKTKTNLKAWLQPYLSEKARIAAQEALEEEKARAALRAAGETPDLAGARPSQSVAGTMGRVSLKTRQVYEINDLRAAAEFLASLNDPPQDFVDGILSASSKLIKAGLKVPGVEARTVEVVA